MPDRYMCTKNEYQNTDSSYSAFSYLRKSEKNTMKNGKLIATEPLDVILELHTSDFVWQTVTVFENDWVFILPNSEPTLF
jgi:hypothetical protein